MAFDKDLIDAVLKHADIVKVVSSYLTVTKKGRNFVAVCPFHDDTDPSLTISPEKQIFKCFVCGTSGNAISFVSKYEHLSYQDAVRKVAELCDFHDPRLEKNVYVKKIDPELAAIYKCLTDLTLYYQYALGTPEGKDGLEYFDERNLNSDMRAKYRLGYAFKDGKQTCKFLQQKGHSIKTIEDAGIASIGVGDESDRNKGRVIFPICDKDGNVVGFSARRIKDGPEAKYVNSPETKVFHKASILYNYHIAKEKSKIDGYIYVVEGFMDVYALSKIGIDSAVAVMGTALTPEHITLLRALNVEIRLCLDGDLPGQTAMMESAKRLAKAGLKARIVDNQGSSKDADEILNEDGPEALKAYLNNLVDRIDFVLNYYKRTNPLKTSEEKKRLVQNFVPVLVNINSHLELSSYIRKLAAITGYDVESITEVVNKAKNAPKEKLDDVYVEFHPERKVLRRLETAERELLYQMLRNPSAITFYEENSMYFFDEVYRNIANYLIEYASNGGELEPSMVISYLEANEIPNVEAITREISSILMEKNHPDVCNKELLENLKASIDDEKTKIYEKDTLEMLLAGKSELEKARIINDHVRRKKNKK